MQKNMKKLSINQRFMRACVDNGFFATIQDKLDSFLRKSAIKKVSKNTKIVDNKIVFLTFSGNYDCNPKAISEGIKRLNLDVQRVWGVYVPEQKNTGDFPSDVKTFVRKTYDFYKELASAKVIIDNDINLAEVGYKKKKNQILIETWHGSIGIKKFGKAGNDDISWQQKATEQAQMTDYIISNSDFENQVYKMTEFSLCKEVLKIGHPRNDILFSSDKNIIEELQGKVRTRFGIESQQKICLFAPTFRDNDDVWKMRIDYSALKKALNRRFGGEWVILTRYHNVTKNKFRLEWENGSSINVSNYSDLQEILVCVDVGITDYSSWICEYLLKRKPGFIFAYDAVKYIGKERKLFFDLSELPFTVAYSFDELIENILNYNEEEYVEKCDKFLNDNGSVDDGHATERAIEIIKNLIR